MKKNAEFLNLPILGIAEGTKLAESHDLLIDADKKSIAAIVIENENWYCAKKLLPYSKVIDVGHDAILIKNKDSIFEFTHEKNDIERLLKENIKIIGTKVINKGTVEGIIADIIFDDKTGEIKKVIMLSDDETEKEILSNNISIFGKDITITADDMSFKSIESDVVDAHEALDAAESFNDQVNDTDSLNTTFVSVSEQSSNGFNNEHPEEVFSNERSAEDEYNDDKNTDNMPAPEETTKEESALVSDNHYNEDISNELNSQEDNSGDSTESIPEKEELKIEQPVHEKKPEVSNNISSNEVDDNKFSLKIGSIIGKLSTCRITNQAGEVIVENNMAINKEIIYKAKKANKLIELVMRANY